MKSTVWELFGNRDMTLLYSQIPLIYYNNDKNNETSCIGYCKLAFKVYLRKF